MLFFYRIMITDLFSCRSILLSIFLFTNDRFLLFCGQFPCVFLPFISADRIISPPPMCSMGLAFDPPPGDSLVGAEGNSLSGALDVRYDKCNDLQVGVLLIATLPCNLIWAQCPIQAAPSLPPQLPPQSNIVSTLFAPIHPIVHRLSSPAISVGLNRLRNSASKYLPQNFLHSAAFRGDNFFLDLLQKVSYQQNSPRCHFPGGTNRRRTFGGGGRLLQWPHIRREWRQRQRKVREQMLRDAPSIRSLSP